MNPVTACPKTLEEATFASKRLGCGIDRFGKNQYMCLPDVKKTSLFEFCHDGIMGIQLEGNCLEVNPSDRTLSTESCTDFISGCPENVFWNHQFYMYPACQDINPKKQCYSAQPSCTQTDNVSDEFNHTYVIIAILFLILIILFFVLSLRWTRRKRRSKETNLENETDHLAENTDPLKCLRDGNVNMEGGVQTIYHRPTTMPDNKPDGPHKDEEEPFINRERSATLGVSATKKQKIHEVKGHEFQSFFFKQLTYCSFCDKLLRGVIKKQGYKCRNCNLAVHKICHDKIEGNCNGSKNDSKMMSGGIDKNYRHKFKINTHGSPTFCKHCGSLLYGVNKQGLKCEVCEINCHKKCESFISYPCGAKK